VSSPPGFLVGIDVGTTSCKAVALRPDGTPAGAAERLTPWRRAPTAEVDPFALVAAAVAADDATTTAGGGASGVGVASFGETGFLLDRRGEPIVVGRGQGGPMAVRGNGRGDVGIADFPSPGIAVAG
jgi:sugar (pentulose or hexulose) kinase